jgi:lysophospholipid acyltransferase (LPLAT)-like uncharacterized protein
MSAETHKPTFSDWLVILIATPIIHLLGLTLRIKETGQTQWGPNARQEEPPLWALWHETILMSVWHHRDQDVHVMISASRDGELISRIAKFFGYTPVRGSSSRGGREALTELVNYLKDGKRCAITPDGPRGPRREMKIGVLSLSRLTGCPIVPFAFEAEHCWRLRSWDKFIIPKPFSRAVFVYGNPIKVPRHGGEEYLKQIQAELDRVTLDAENYFKQKAV